MLTLPICLALSVASPATGHPPASSQGPPVNLAFVLLSEAKLPSAEAIVRAFPAFAGPAERLRVSPKEAEKPSAALLSFDLAPGGTALVALVAVAVPGGEADQGVQFSLPSLTREWTLGPHRAHLIVTLQAPEGAGATARERLSAFTSFLAAVTSVAPAVGVYWGSAGATHEPAFFVETARSQEVVERLALWTGVSLANEPDGRGISLLSLGMKQLGLPELLLVVSPRRAREVLALFLNLLDYAVSRGTPLPEGDTIGMSEDERVPIRYVPSPVDSAARVWRVEFE